MYPQNINIYVRSDKFIYPNTTNKAVWKKKIKAIGIKPPAIAIRPITSVQKPRTRNIRATLKSPSLYYGQLTDFIIPFANSSVNEKRVSKSKTFTKLACIFSSYYNPFNRKHV